MISENNSSHYVLQKNFDRQTHWSQILYLKIFCGHWSSRTFEGWNWFSFERLREHLIFCSATKCFIFSSSKKMDRLLLQILLWISGIRIYFVAFMEKVIFCCSFSIQSKIDKVTKTGINLSVQLESIKYLLYELVNILIPLKSNIRFCQIILMAKGNYWILRIGVCSGELSKIGHRFSNVI